MDKYLEEQCKKSVAPKSLDVERAYSGILGGAGAGCAASPGPSYDQGEESHYHSSRRLIEQIVDHHNTQSRRLCALLRALPQEMSREAEQALRDLALGELQRIG